MKALVVNCTLKPSPERSNTGALAEVVAAPLRDDGVVVEEVRAVDHSFPYGVETEMGDGDEWWSHSTGRAAAANLLAVVKALAVTPIPAPPSESD